MHKLPIQYNYDDVDILKALSKANNKLGELNGLIRLLPNPHKLHWVRLKSQVK